MGIVLNNETFFVGGDCTKWRDILWEKQIFGSVSHMIQSIGRLLGKRILENLTRYFCENDGGEVWSQTHIWTISGQVDKKAELVRQMCQMKHQENLVLLRLTGSAFAVYQQLKKEGKEDFSVILLGRR